MTASATAVADHAVDPASIATRYLEIWNERDGDKRRALIAALWAADASFRDPIAAADGVAGIDQVIEGVQNRFPDFRFRQIGAADGFGDYVRLSWGLGPDLGPNGVDAPIRGTDFGLVEHGRLKDVTGFFDQLPG
ncbi:MAG TPA: nuclear transport factor 2 family protein [Caulobacteraceae bacterium]|nr:nuclear transport factor 2 family protein [Caulobacteraceae bacterium]